MMLRRFVLSLFGAIALSSCAPVEAPAAEGPVEISLTRSACYGFCPVYSVVITGEGEVRYNGEAFVDAVGERTATISPVAVQALAARFDDIGFDRLDDAYRAEVTDLPTFAVSITRNGRTKTVVDYGGISAGMPRSVRDLQAEIDRVAGTARWVLRNGEPVRDRPEH